MAPGNEKYYPGLQTLIDNLPGVVYRCRNDRDWTMQYISAAIIELSGYPASEFINNRKRSYGSLIHEKDRAYVWNEIQKAVEDRSRFTLEYRIVNREGNIKWVWERGSLVQDESGNRFIEGFIEDIHDWKIAEENVRNSEFRFRLFAESAPVGVVLSDKEENTIFINKRFTEIFGYTINDIPSVNEWWELAYPDEKFRKQVQEAWKTKMLKSQSDDEKVKSLEFPVHCKDGTVKDIEFRLASDYELNYIIFTDITERKKTEKELEQTRFGIENATIGVYQIDESGIIRYVNKIAAASLGYEVSELIGKSILDIDKSFTPESFREHREKTRRQGSRKIITSHRRKDGSEFPVEVTIDYFWFRDELMSFSFSIDITDRVEAENALRTSEEKFRSLVDQAAEMLFLHDLNGKIIDINLAAIRNTGYSRTELEEMNVLDIDPDAGKRRDKVKFWQALKADDPAVTFETRHKRKDGEIYPAEVTMSRVFILDNSYILALARNITERKKSEEELLKLKESLQMQVAEKTKELKERVLELERFRDATIDRELRMKELRDELELLRKEKNK